MLIFYKVENKFPEDYNEITPYIYAIANSKIIKLLVDKVENPNTTINNFTILHVAAKCGYSETFKLIMDKLEVSDHTAMPVRNGTLTK